MKRFLAVLLILAAVSSAQECIYPGGGGPSTQPYPYEKDDDREFSFGDGDYSNDVSITGHYFAEGYQVGFDELWVGNEGEEFCDFSSDYDWQLEHSTHTGTSPFTLTGEGGYADDPWDCLFGHRIWAYSEWRWSNSPNPMIDDDKFRAICHDFNAPQDPTEGC